ncbi:hypothetical protein D3OALGA1CA_3901 [Olavius algarvensis associated proteobacterium Delta 3]|nr:hypothetical protein D3OALGA1CA_3901 [Olavius algarvensis associated proteobacterium Delta 3]
MKRNQRLHRLVILMLCVGITGALSFLPNTASGCQKATGLVHVSDVATHRHYRTAWAEIGARPYIDRRYQIRQITPGLAGGVLVRTANNDKWFSKERLFTLNADQDAFVYICFDQRAFHQQGSAPEWLGDDGWEEMKDESIITSDWPASPMVVFRKTVDGGDPIPLRGNHYGGDNGARSNFFVVVKFLNPGSQLVEILQVSSNRRYRVSEAKRGARAYIDRRYRIKTLSHELDGGVLVRTANNDKRNTAENHLSLYVYKPATLFVAYDKRGSADPPQWLDEWKLTDLTVRTGDYRASPMVVFSRSFDSDEVAELGGNRFNGGHKAWSNYFVVAVPDEPWKRKALMVVGKTRLNFSDALVKSRLESRGFSVMVKDDDEVEAADAEGKDLILLSETVYSKRVGDKFAQVQVPIICWEPYLFDDLGMTGAAAGIDFGYEYRQREIHVVQPDHPMAANLEKDTPVTRCPTRFGWAMPTDTAEVVATLVGDLDKAAVFYYDVDTEMPGGFPAPARRIGLFFDKYTPKKLNADGRRLLEAAFDTALGVNGLKIYSDNSWKSTDQEYEGWSAPEFDDSDWRQAAAPYPNRKPANHWFRIPGTNAQYMWDFPGGGEMTGYNGPADVWFRKSFELPVAPSALTSAAVTLAVDDVYDFYVNGKFVVSNWDSPAHNGLVTVDILPYLEKGRNVLAIYGSDAYRGYEWALFEATIEWEPVNIPDREWTFMVYLNGDNENETHMLNDLQEMEYGLFKAMETDPDVIHKLALVVQFDGRGGDNSVRYLVQPDPSPGGEIVSEVIDPYLGEVNMGHPQTLKDFIRFSQKEYEAPNYALILANHGEAVASPSIFNMGKNYTSSPAKYILWDETSGDDRLYVGEVTDGLGETESVDLLGLDTGFMGTVETAYQYRPESGKFGADYMVASPAKALSEGWDYSVILDSLGDVAELTPELFARTIVAEAYSDPGIQDNALSAYALVAVADVKAKFDQLASAIRRNPNTWNFAKSVRGYSANGGPRLYNGPPIIEYFDDQLIRNMGNPDGLSAPSNWLQTPLFDLYSFSNALSAGSIPANVRMAAADLTGTVETCVLSSSGKVTRAYFNGRQGTELPLSDGVNGLAFFFPDGDFLIWTGGPAYAYQWWYTAGDTETWTGNMSSPARPQYLSDPLYGHLDFCTSGSMQNSIENWRELLEYWYDRSNRYTPDSY